LIQMNELILALSFVLSLLLTLYGTPVTQKVAQRYQLLDYPDGNLKRQKEPVPYMGGVIIYFAFISPVSLLFQFNKELLGILFASSILLVVGLFDDLKAIGPGIKFLFQVVATYILIKSGIFINLVVLPPWLNSILSFLWILSIINAFNIIDIMDGLSSSVGVLASLTLFVISLYNKNFLISILALSLAAALLGFLKFNWEPARIYLGDAGSMFIGLVIGALTIMGDYTMFNDLAFVSGILILSIPIFDMIYVIILRLIKGRSPFFGSPDHFTLRLKKKYNLTAARTVAVIIGIQLVLSGLVIWNYFGTPLITLITTTAVVIFFTGFGVVLALEKME
jgi:UDP-GlcNAc:undecaprenyl-phosphate/decaprenyl-phosphate GlcNAc-1-phosphate transferase